MSVKVHYKFGVLGDKSTSFCLLPSEYYPKKNTSKMNKLNPLPKDSLFGEGFCTDCNDKLIELKLIKE
jgi:hypothetical protein